MLHPMVTGQPTNFTIKAMEDSAVIEIRKDVLEELMNKSHM
ncbi:MULTISPECIES: cyclic nucleotide-binding domain-containing protein [Bacillus]|nr:cyclic nucleotide-binding domain-containing protein [Bacillus sonorensis]